MMESGFVPYFTYPEWGFYELDTRILATKPGWLPFSEMLDLLLKPGRGPGKLHYHDPSKGAP